MLTLGAPGSHGLSLGNVKRETTKKKQKQHNRQKQIRTEPLYLKPIRTNPFLPKRQWAEPIKDGANVPAANQNRATMETAALMSI